MKRHPRLVSVGRLNLDYSIERYIHRCKKYTRSETIETAGRGYASPRSRMQEKSKTQVSMRMLVNEQERRVDALALRADEGRNKLR